VGKGAGTREERRGKRRDSFGEKPRAQEEFPAAGSTKLFSGTYAGRMKVYLDGKFVDSADAKVSVFDHGLLYGDGVFEGIRLYGGNIFRLRSTSSGSNIRPRRSCCSCRSTGRS
jgi:hypothetical protein